MPRLIEVQPDQDLTAGLSVRIGDLIVFEASGGAIRNETGAVEMVGSFVRSVVGGSRVVAPMGAPNAVILRARARGAAEIGLVTGDPWGRSSQVSVRLIVEE